MRATKLASLHHKDKAAHWRRRRSLRVKLMREEGGYVWRTAGGKDCGIAPLPTVEEALDAARRTWDGNDGRWELRASWA